MKLFEFLSAEWSEREITRKSAVSFNSIFKVEANE